VSSDSLMVCTLHLHLVLTIVYYLNWFLSDNFHLTVVIIARNIFFSAQRKRRRSGFL